MGSARWKQKIKLPGKTLRRQNTVATCMSVEETGLMETGRSSMRQFLVIDPSAGIVESIAPANALYLAYGGGIEASRSESGGGDR